MPARSTDNPAPREGAFTKQSQSQNRTPPAGLLAGGLLAQNSRLGSAARNRPLHQALAFAKPLIAPGLPDPLYDFRVGPRCSGKERDVETGNDWFLKRYFGSPSGRFTSPDPIGITKQKLWDPQQWNMYAYSRNNPLRFMDPTGMYVTSCKASDISKCDQSTQDFEAARQRNLNSKDKSVRASAKAYGDYGKAGVTVTFRSQDKGGGVVTFDRDASGKATGTLTVNITPENLREASKGPLGQAATDAEVAHEGTHVKDDLQLINSGYKPKYDITHRETERHAYSTENRVIETEVNRSNPDWQSNKAIDNYLKANPTLYPNPDAPILDPAAIPAGN